MGDYASEIAERIFSRLKCRISQSSDIPTFCIFCMLENVGFQKDTFSRNKLNFTLKLEGQKRLPIIFRGAIMRVAIFLSPIFWTTSFIFDDEREHWVLYTCSFVHC